MNTGFIGHIFKKYFSDNLKLSQGRKICEPEHSHVEAGKPLGIVFISLVH